MKKLEDIPKKQVFTTPEGYFDKLPGVIQSRIQAESTKGWSLSWSMSLKLALPTVVIALALVLWLRPESQNIEEQLSMIDTEQLTFYLDELDVTTDDLATEIDWTTADLINLEDAVYINMDNSELDALMENIELDNL